MARESKWAAGLILFLGAAYVLLVLPKLYFRHDDWWILGNVVRYLPTDPGFLWRPTLYLNGVESTWFFRPGFKAVVFGLYQAFGFGFAGWGVSLLVPFLLSLWLGFLTLSYNPQTKGKALWFVIAVVFSASIHFGSLAWVGEGAMNVPQLFLLSFSTYGFARSKKTGWYLLSLFSFAISLLFKESSVFHLLFLSAFGWSQKIPRRTLFFRLLPFSLLAGVYLVARLWFMPIHQGYFAELSPVGMLRSVLLLTVPLVLPVAVWGLYLWWNDRRALRNYAKGLRGLGIFLPYLLVSISVYVGHDFFSPGWYLVLGYFFILALGLLPLPKVAQPRSLLFFGLGLLVTSTLPVAFRLNQMGWTKWGEIQKSVFSSLASAPSQATEILVRDCPLTGHSQSINFHRVVASEEGVRQMWFLTHGTDIPVKWVACGAVVDLAPTSLLVDWNYPEVGRVLASP
jgi:hypothetical protein